MSRPDGSISLSQKFAPGWALAWEREDDSTFRPLETCVPGVRRLDDAELAARVDQAYRELFDGMAERGSASTACYPVRFWNFLPGIHDMMGDGRDRYMAFNAGRLVAFEKQYAGRSSFDRDVATASCVGHDGEDLVILCLCGGHAGSPVDNPRQIRPYRYSSRFGPMPPCFARATLVRAADGRRLLLVGGTASIRGEESVYAGDLEGQFQETLENLASLVAAAMPDVPPDRDSRLAHYRELRIYHPRADDLHPLRRWISSAMPNVERPEFVRANLCRRELLVEIEGVAEVG